MPASYVTSQRFVSATGQSSYSPTYNLQNPSGNNRLVVVCVSLEDDGINRVSSVTLGGNSPNGSSSNQAGTGYSANAWLGWWFDGDLPATSGNKTIAVTCDGTIIREIMVHVIEYTDVTNALVTTRTTASTRTDAGNLTGQFSTVDEDDELVVGMFTAGGTTYGSPVNLTQRQAAAATSFSGGIGDNLNVDAPGPFNTGWNSLSTRGCFIAAIFKTGSPSSSSSSSSSSVSESSSSSSLSGSSSSSSSSSSVSSSSSSSSSSESSSSSSSSSSESSSSSSSSESSSSKSSSSFSVICTIDPSDDFTGNDGDPLNPQRWVHISGIVTPTIQNNRASWYSNTTGTATGIEENRTVLVSGGHVDVYFDYEVTQMTSYNYWYWWFINADTGATLATFYGIHLMPTYNMAYGVNGNLSGFQYINGVMVSAGKLRMEKDSNGIIRAWYDSGSGWEWNGDPDGIKVASIASNINLKVRMGMYNNDALGPFEGGIDNYVATATEMSCYSSTSSSSSSSSTSIASNSYVPKYWEEQEEGNQSYDYARLIDIPEANQADFYTWLTGSPISPSANSDYVKRYLMIDKELSLTQMYYKEWYHCLHENWMNWYRWHLEGEIPPEPSTIPWASSSSSSVSSSSQSSSSESWMSFSSSSSSSSSSESSSSESESSSSSSSSSSVSESSSSSSDSSSPAIAQIGSTHTALAKSVSWATSYTQASGTNRVMIVHGASWNASITAVSFGGVSLTKLGNVTYNNYDASIWYLVNPTVQTANIQITASMNSYQSIAVTSWQNASQDTNPFRYYNTGYSNVSPIQVTTNSALTDLVLDSFALDTTGARTPGGGQTELADFIVATQYQHVASYEPGASPNVTMSWSGSGLWAGIAGSLKKA